MLQDVGGTQHSHSGESVVTVTPDFVLMWYQNAIMKLVFMRIFLLSY